MRRRSLDMVVEEQGNDPSSGDRAMTPVSSLGVPRHRNRSRSLDNSLASNANFAAFKESLKVSRWTSWNTWLNDVFIWNKCATKHARQAQAKYLETRGNREFFLASALKFMLWKFTCAFACAWAFLAGVNHLYIMVRAQNGQNMIDLIEKTWQTGQISGFNRKVQTVPYCIFQRYKLIITLVKQLKLYTETKKNDRKCVL